jgi:hypothetical protein
MRNFYYDAEGDILTVTFGEAPKDEATGIELHENVVLYFTPDQGKVLELILISYGAMLKDQKPLHLKALTKLQPVWQQKILNILQKEPANHFLHIEKRDAAPIHLLYIKKVFDPEIMKAAA